MKIGESCWELRRKKSACRYEFIYLLVKVGVSVKWQRGSGDWSSDVMSVVCNSWQNRSSLKSVHLDTNTEEIVFDKDLMIDIRSWTRPEQWNIYTQTLCQVCQVHRSISPSTSNNTEQLKARFISIFALSLSSVNSLVIFCVFARYQTTNHRPPTRIKVLVLQGSWNSTAVSERYQVSGSVFNVCD